MVVARKTPIYFILYHFFRGHLDENCKFSTMQVLRIIELQRSALSSKDVRLEVKLSEDYSLLVQFTIRETMRDMKLQQEEEGLGLSTYPCTLCDADKEAIKDPEHIQRGFPD